MMDELKQKSDSVKIEKQTDPDKLAVVMRGFHTTAVIMSLIFVSAS